MIRTLNIVMVCTSVAALVGVYGLKYSVEETASEKVAPTSQGRPSRAASMFEIRPRSTAIAASSGESPSGRPSFSAKAARTRSSGTGRSTDSRPAGFSRPSSRLASLMVGSVPPRP